LANYNAPRIIGAAYGRMVREAEVSGMIFADEENKGDIE
jgi:hypothetical protein